MKLAKVVATHPESHSVDLLMLDDGRRIPGVQVMAASASSSSGVAGLPKPDAQDSANPYDAPNKSGRDLVAVVCFYRDVPVVMGFLFPQVSECLFPDLDRYINRTASDVYWTVDGKGNAELFHPSGAYVRFGASGAHEDLRGKDFDKKFNPKRNADQHVHIHIEQAGGVASVDIAPDGAIVVHTASTTLVKSDAGATVQAPTVLVDSPDSHFTGAVTIDGLLTYKAGLAGAGGATIDGDVSADGVSLKNHTHGGIQQGSSSTEKPD